MACLLSLPVRPGQAPSLLELGLQPDSADDALEPEEDEEVADADVEVSKPRIRA